MKIDELNQDLQKIKIKTPKLYSDIFQVSVPLHQFYKRFLGNADAILKEKHGVTSLELDALASLYYSGGDDYTLTPTQLSSRLLFSSSSLAKLVKRLEKLDYIKRVANSNDKRSNLVKLTKEGELLLLNASLALKQSDEESFRGLDEKDLSELKRILLKVLQNKE